MELYRWFLDQAHSNIIERRGCDRVHRGTGGGFRPGPIRPGSWSWRAASDDVFFCGHGRGTHDKRIGDHLVRLLWHNAACSFEYHPGSVGDPPGV